MNKNGKIKMALLLLFILGFLVLAIVALLARVISNKNNNQNGNNLIESKVMQSEEVVVNDEETINNDIKQESPSSLEYNTFTFETAYGTVNIEAEKAYTARGTAGASNIIFYLKNNEVYMKESTSEKLIANGVDDIYYEGNNSESLIIKLNSTSTINEDVSYVIYDKF